MRKLLLTISLFSCMFALSAQEEEDAITLGFPYEKETVSRFYPFSFSGEAFWLGKADFRTPGFEGEHIRYSQMDIAYSYIQPFSEEVGVIFGAGYVSSNIIWDENPAFLEHEFNYVSFSLAAFSKKFPSWTWSIIGNMYMDTEQLDLAHYALYQVMLWGKYHWCDWTTLHFGFLLELGLNQEQIWPILGFEVAPYPDIWSLHVIYPLDITFDYYLTRCLSVGASVRFIRSRHRVKNSDPVPRGIFEYLTTGIEGDLTYKPARWFSMTGFVGRAFAGDLKVADSKNHHATHYKFDGSYYAGASAVLSF